MARFLLSISPAAASLDPSEGGQTAVVFDRTVNGYRCLLRRVFAHRQLRGSRSGITLIAPDRYGFRGVDSDADVVIDIGDEELTVSVPLLATRQVYYSTSDGRVSIADDPRLLVRPDMPIDPRGVFCILQLSGIVPPFSLWEGVTRLAPGKRLVIGLTTLRCEERKAPPRVFGAVGTEAAPSIDHQVELLTRILDAELERRKQDDGAVFLYSGGVDSGLLAARAAALGWRDANLVHCSTRPGDPESVHAQSMADRLGFNLRVVQYAPGEAVSLLDEMFDSYASVNDFSMLPTWFLARHVVAEFGNDCSVVFDGTGADIAFGGSAKWREWRRLYAVPDRVRRLIGSAYRYLDLWAKPGRLEDIVRKMRRGTGWPLAYAPLLGSPMADIGFHAPNDVTSDVLEALQTWTHEVLEHEPEDTRFAATRMVHRTCVCACQKAYAAFDRSAMVQAFPFLSPDMVALALSHISRWSAPGEEPKAVLKVALSRSVPRELVYRRKSGFSIPPAATFGHRAFLDRLDELLASQAHPFTQWLDRATMLRIRDALVNREPLAWYTYEFVWAAVFGFHWLRRAEQYVRDTSYAAAPGPV